MGEGREQSKQVCVIETVDRGAALELAELPLETRAAEEAGCRGCAQMPGLARQNLEVFAFFLWGEGLSAPHGFSTGCSPSFEKCTKSMSEKIHGGAFDFFSMEHCLGSVLIA